MYTLVRDGFTAYCCIWRIVIISTECPLRISVISYTSRFIIYKTNAVLVPIATILLYRRRVYSDDIWSIYLCSVQIMKCEQKSRRISVATLSLYSVHSAVVNAPTVCGCRTVTARQSNSPINGEKFPKICTDVERGQDGNPGHLLTEKSSPNYARL